jgi:hypothetical protein
MFEVISKKIYDKKYCTWDIICDNKLWFAKRHFSNLDNENGRLDKHHPIHKGYTTNPT